MHKTRTRTGDNKGIIPHKRNNVVSLCQGEEGLYHLLSPSSLIEALISTATLKFADDRQ
jgi:hypothetical protein